MRRATGLALVALVLVPASAGAGTTRPPLALTATPARVALAGTGQAGIRVTNPGVGPIGVDVTRAGFSLDLRGRPRVTPRGDARAAVSWLAVRPARFVLAAGRSRLLTVRSRLPAHTEPGDHDAVVLLTTRPFRSSAVAVRMRIGVVVVVRAPGRVVRHLTLGRLTVRRAHGSRVLELGVSNRGNVTELLGAAAVKLSLRRRGAEVAVRGEARELRPGTVGLVQFRYRGRLRGWVTARARLVRPQDGRVLSRSFRVKL
jgi:hypothetical protein